MLLLLNKILLLFSKVFLLLNKILRYHQVDRVVEKTFLIEVTL